MFLLLQRRVEGRGHEKGALVYSTTEHLALLWITADVLDSFNSSEASDESRIMHALIVANFYNLVGLQPRQSTTFQSHLWRCMEG